MSHSKGFLAGTCPGVWRNTGRAREGYQQQRCSRCSKVRRKAVRPCLFFHSWVKVGAASHGKQKVKCGRCNTRQTNSVTSCFLFHSWHGCKVNRKLHCSKCNTPK